MRCLSRQPTTYRASQQPIWWFQKKFSFNRHLRYEKKKIQRVTIAWASNDASSFDNFSSILFRKKKMIYKSIHFVLVLTISESHCTRLCIYRRATSIVFVSTNLPNNKQFNKGGNIFQETKKNNYAKVDSVGVGKTMRDSNSGNNSVSCNVTKKKRKEKKIFYMNKHIITKIDRSVPVLSRCELNWLWNKLANSNNKTGELAKIKNSKSQRTNEQRNKYLSTFE